MDYLREGEGRKEGREGERGELGREGRREGGKKGGAGCGELTNISGHLSQLVPGEPQRWASRKAAI